MLSFLLHTKLKTKMLFKILVIVLPSARTESLLKTKSTTNSWTPSFCRDHRLQWQEFWLVCFKLTNVLNKLPYKPPLGSDQKQYSLHFFQGRTLGESAFSSQSDNEEKVETKFEELQCRISHESREYKIWSAQSRGNAMPNFWKLWQWTGLSIRSKLGSVKNAHVRLSFQWWISASHTLNAPRWGKFSCASHCTTSSKYILVVFTLQVLLTIDMSFPRCNAVRMFYFWVHSVYVRNLKAG